MTTKVYGDGVVELAYGDSYPPGHVGQHTSMNQVWFRVDGGEWECSPLRTMHQHVECLDRVGSVEEFRRLVESL